MTRLTALTGRPLDSKRHNRNSQRKAFHIPFTGNPFLTGCQVLDHYVFSGLKIGN